MRLYVSKSAEITLCLSITVFLSMLASMIPPTSESVPLLGVFFSVSFVLVSASVLFTVFAMNIYYKEPDFNEMGDYVSALLRQRGLRTSTLAQTRAVLLYWIPWLLFMERPTRKLTINDLPNIFSRKSMEKMIYFEEADERELESERKLTEATDAR